MKLNQIIQDMELKMQNLMQENEQMQDMLQDEQSFYMQKQGKNKIDIVVNNNTKNNNSLLNITQQTNLNNTNNNILGENKNIVNTQQSECNLSVYNENNITVNNENIDKLRKENTGLKNSIEEYKTGN